MYNLSVTLKEYFFQTCVRTFHGWIFEIPTENNLSKYTNRLVFAKAGEYCEFFHLRDGTPNGAKFKKQNCFHIQQIFYQGQERFQSS